MLWDPDALICWRTVEAFGVLTPRLLASDRESLVTLLRKLFWSMNDESGMLCRRAPETIAEILLHAPSLRHDFLPNLTHFTCEGPFEAGVCRGYIRLLDSGTLTPEELQTISRTVPDLQTLLAYDSVEIRGWAACALVRLGVAVETTRFGDQTLAVYSFATGALTEQSIAQLIA
jgi:hypothetical protein